MQQLFCTFLVQSNQWFAKKVSVTQPRTLAKFIGEVIDRTGLSNVEIANALGIKPENVSRWRNTSKPQNISVQHLDTLLGLLKPRLTLGQCLFFPDEVVGREVMDELLPLVRAAIQPPAQVAQPPPPPKPASKERRG